jgi:hypothetical protein
MILDHLTTHESISERPAATNNTCGVRNHRQESRFRRQDGWEAFDSLGLREHDQHDQRHRVHDRARLESGDNLRNRYLRQKV